MKYNLLAVTSLLIPIILLVFIIVEKRKLEKNLVLKQGTLVESKKTSRGARSTVVYRHKFAEYSQYLQGTFNGIGGFFVNNKIKEIYQEPPVGTISKDVYWLNPLLKPAKDRKAFFYVLQSYASSDKRLSYIHLRLQTEPFNKLSYWAEVMQYVLHQQIGRLTLFFIMIANILFFIGAFFKFQQNHTYVVLFFIVFFYHLILVLF